MMPIVAIVGPVPAQTHGADLTRVGSTQKGVHVQPITANWKHTRIVSNYRYARQIWPNSRLCDPLPSGRRDSSPLH